MKTYQTRNTTCTPTHDRSRSKSSRKSMEGPKTTSSFTTNNIDKKNFAKSTFSSNNKSVGKIFTIPDTSEITQQSSYPIP